MSRTHGQRADKGAELAFDTLRTSVSTSLPEKAVLREQAAIYSRVAETFAMRDQAEANRVLARAQERLAVSVDSLVDELRIARGVPDQA